MTKSYQNIAAIHFEKEEYEVAETYTKKAIEIFPTNPQLYANLAVVYMRENKKNLAVEAFQKALQLDPQNEVAIQGIRELSK